MEIAKRTGATVVAIVELAAEIEGDGVADVRNPNIGGTVHVRLGLGQAGARLAHGRLAGRHRRTCPPAC